MREILFRGKRKDTKEWIEGCYIKSVVANSPFAYITPSYPSEPVRVYSKTVGQYAGLTDKNGKKIFEGDIVKAMYHTTKRKDYVLGTVVFENGTFKLLVFGRINKGEFSFIYSTYDEDKKTSMYAIENNFIFRDYLLEVIGNIHDNPELLKGGEG